jgi:hypothetical protein
MTLGSAARSIISGSSCNPSEATQSSSTRSGTPRSAAQGRMYLSERGGMWQIYRLVGSGRNRQIAAEGDLVSCVHGPPWLR